MSRLQQEIAREHPEWILPRLCQKNANKAGFYVAVITGALTFPIARRLGLDKNRALFSALTTSSIGAYVGFKKSFEHCERTYNFFQSMDKVQHTDQEAQQLMKE